MVFQLQPNSIVQFVSLLAADSGGRKFESQLGHIIFMETDREIISPVFLAFLLVQGGHLSVTDERVHKYWVTA